MIVIKLVIRFSLWGIRSYWWCLAAEEMLANMWWCPVRQSLTQVFVFKQFLFGGFVWRAVAGGFRTQSLQVSVDVHLPLPPSVPAHTFLVGPAGAEHVRLSSGGCGLNVRLLPFTCSAVPLRISASLSLRFHEVAASRSGARLRFILLPLSRATTGWTHGVMGSPAATFSTRL